MALLARSVRSSSPPTPAVKAESIIDTLRDLAVYAVTASILREEESDLAMTVQHPRIVVNAAALTNLVYTGISVVQDMAAGHFTSDDKVFLSSILVGLVVLLVPLAGGSVDNAPPVVPVTVESDAKQ